MNQVQIFSVDPFIGRLNTIICTPHAPSYARGDDSGFDQVSIGLIKDLQTHCLPT